jgi:mannose-6-phosphate isomerase-like protein (cupin superfamily)
MAHPSIAPARTPVTGRRLLPVGDDDLTPGPGEVARALAGRTELWRPLVRFAEPRFVTRISTTPRWEAWLLTWLPGQSTGLHDHGGSAGAFAVLAGSVDEDVATRTAEGPRLRTRRFGAGQVRAFGPEHLHEVAARGRRPAVTLHVYAPRLREMTRYAMVAGQLSVTAREQEGQDW